jgi:hypothetical protein
VPNLAQRDEDENENGRTIEKEAESLDMGKETLRKLKFIGDISFQKNPDVKKYENIQSDACDILDELDRGELSYDAAYNKLKLIILSYEDLPESQYAGKLVNEIKNGITTQKAYEKLEKFKKSLVPTNRDHTKFDIPIKRGVIPPGVHSVIVTDLSKFNEKEAKEVKFTEALNAAVFLWANTSNIRDRIDLLEKCDFSLKAIGVCKTENSSGIYFQGTVEFLLLSIRGIIQNSDFKPDIILNIGSTHDEIYEIAEKMFPNEKYIDLDKDPKRDGWNVSYLKENITHSNQPVKNDEENELAI